MLVISSYVQDVANTEGPVSSTMARGPILSRTSYRLAVVSIGLKAARSNCMYLQQFMQVVEGLDTAHVGQENVLWLVLAGRSFTRAFLSQRGHFGCAAAGLCSFHADRRGADAVLFIRCCSLSRGSEVCSTASVPSGTADVLFAGLVLPGGDDVLFAALAMSAAVDPHFVGPEMSRRAEALLAAS